MQLKQLLRHFAATSVAGSVHREVSGLTCDSRRVTPGMIYFALPGEQADDPDSISAAIDRGAAAVICERERALPSRATRICVPDARAALARTASSYYEHPSARLQVIGVTGSSGGRTTVAFMLKAMLEAAGRPTGLLSAVQHKIGDRILPAASAAPESLEVQQLMAQMLRAGGRACVMEVSTTALDQSRALGVEFDFILHLQPPREPRVPSGPRGSKKITTHLQLESSTGEDLEVQITSARRPPLRLRATNAALHATGSRCTVEVLEEPRRRFTLHLPLAGRANLRHALVALGTGLTLGLDRTHLVAALDALAPVPGHLEAVASGQPFGVFVDAARTDAALQHTLTTLREITPGRVLLTFGCGGGRDFSQRAQMGAVAARCADFTVITSDNPRREPPARIAAHIEAGCLIERAGSCAVELDRCRAIRQIIGMARSGDTVLIAGKGHETHQEVEATIVPCDDRHHVRTALEELGFGAA